MKILCIGDSNTYGYDPRSYLGSRYAHPWPELLDELYGHETVNLGENGREIPHNKWPIQDMVSRIRGQLPADLIILMLGSNDLLNIFREPLAETENRMRGFLTILRESFPHMPILLLSPPLIREYDGSLLQDSLSFAPIYRALAQDFGIRFADTAAWQPEIAYDGVHLSEAGHRTFAININRLL